MEDYAQLKKDGCVKEVKSIETADQTGALVQDQIKITYKQYNSFTGEPTEDRVEIYAKKAVQDQIEILEKQLSTAKAILAEFK